MDNGIWDELEDNIVDATEMRMKSDLLAEIRYEIKGWNVSQRAAAERAGIGLHKLNDIVTAKIDKLTVKILIKVAVTIGLSVTLKVGPKSEPV